MAAQYPVLGYGDNAAYGQPMERLYTAGDQKKLQALLRQVRVEAGLTQEQLAEKLGRPQSFVSKFESGERRLDVLELRELCRAIGITLPDLVARLEDALRG